MKIRRGQLAAMLQNDEGSWIRFVCSSLAQAHPRSPLFSLPEEARPAKARDWCERARVNGLRTDADVLGFVFMMHELGPNLDQHPYLRAILDREDEPMKQRWERLFDEEDEALDQAYREIELAAPSAERSFHVEQFDRVEEAFPESYRDPRFVRYFQEIKARRG